MAACTRRLGVVARSSHSARSPSQAHRLPPSRLRIHLPAFQRATCLPASWRHYTLPSLFVRTYSANRNIDPAPASQTTETLPFPPTGELKMQRLNEALAALDPYQRAVVESAHPQLLALGAAGTGTCQLYHLS